MYISYIHTVHTFNLHTCTYTYIYMYICMSISKFPYKSYFFHTAKNYIVKMRVIFFAEPSTDIGMFQLPKSSPDYESAGACWYLLLLSMLWQ